LDDQARGRDVLQVACDLERPVVRGLTIETIEEIVRLYREGVSVDAIHHKLSIGWITAARVLDKLVCDGSGSGIRMARFRRHHAIPGLHRRDAGRSNGAELRLA